MKRALGLMLLLVSGGCGGEAIWNGSYAATGTWKLSGPLEGSRTVGDAAADLLLDELAGAAPVPSFLEDDLRDWLSDAVRAPVKTTVDAKVPADLAPGGPLTTLLGQTLASVKLESVITLEGDSDKLEGSESVTGIEFTINGKPHRVDAGEFVGQAGGSIVASWAGEEPTAGTLKIEPHTMAIRYGALVRMLMVELVEATELTGLDADMSSALGCTAIVDAILHGNAGLEISLLGWSHTFGASDLETLCGKAVAMVESRAAGQFELDSPVEVGGTVTWTLQPGTQSVELRSGADFGGTINVLPKAIAPRVGVSFTAAPLPVAQ